MKKLNNNKKHTAFTVVELVIVIAIIAVLAAVLIPTFASLIESGNRSADTQLAKNINTALAIAQAEGKEVNNMTDVLYAINRAGYILENLNPTSQYCYYAWDSETNQILYIDENGEIIYKEKEPSADRTNWWITVSTPEEAASVASKGLSLYFENDITADIALTKLVGVDTGTFKCLGKLSINDDASTAAVEIKGSYTEVTVDAPNATVNQSGIITTLNLQAINNASFHVGGFVETLNATVGHVEIEPAGAVKELVVKTGSIKVTNKGAITTLSAAEGVTLPAANVTTTSGYIGTSTVTGVGANTSNELTVEINSLAELENFRDQVNGGRTYAGTTVNLNCDIDISDRYWEPIGIASRKVNDATDVNVVTGVAGTKTIKCTYFAGTFNGNGHTVEGLNNTGYVPQNNSISFADKHNKHLFVFGFFGTTVDAEIKDLTFTDVNINAGEVMYTNAEGKTDVAGGDSVAAVVGLSAGGITVDNCKVSGKILGFDSVAGIVGRAYNLDGGTDNKLIITNCTNNASITGSAKVSGILGFTKLFEITVNNNTNNGNVECIGDQGNASGIAGYECKQNLNKFIVISGNKNTGTIDNMNQFYIASIAQCCATDQYGTISKIDFTGNTNTGTVPETITKDDVDYTVPLIRVGQHGMTYPNQLVNYSGCRDVKYDSDGYEYTRPAQQ